MIDVGQLLRQQREAQGLSLADVEAQTRIRRRYLEALEAGDWEQLPNQVVARGFLRTYATHLGLDPDELLAESKPKKPDAPINGEAQDNESSPADAVYTPIDLDLYEDPTGNARRRGRTLRLIVLIVLVAALFILLVRFVLPYLQDLTNADIGPVSTVTLPEPGAQPTTPLIAAAEDTPELGETIVATEPPTETAVAERPTNPSPTDAPTSTSEPIPTPTTTPVGQLIVQITIGQRSWVRLLVDGVQIIEGILQPGFSQTYSANRSIDLLAGNAAGVSVDVNGETQSPLGEPGEIVRLIWTIEDGVVIESTPQVLPAATTAAETAAPAEGTPTPES
ncbi:MAG: helix-turn-helix domain-containing protein [Caldilineales bacterium]|nr:helix-turn-helix domain-containing protein [Caldilineales bacterium]